MIEGSISLTAIPSASPSLVCLTGSQQQHVDGQANEVLEQNAGCIHAVIRRAGGARRGAAAEGRASRQRRLRSTLHWDRGREHPAQEVWKQVIPAARYYTETRKGQIPLPGLQCGPVKAFLLQNLALFSCAHLPCLLLLLAEGFLCAVILRSVGRFRYNIRTLANQLHTVVFPHIPEC